MSAVHEAIEAPLDREQLAERWRAMCADPSFEDIAGKVELTEWGEILIMSPVGKGHGLLAARAAEVLRDADLLLAEDTRHTAQLLHACGIQRTAGTLESLHEHNERVCSQ